MLQCGPKYDYHQPIKKDQQLKFQYTLQLSVAASQAHSYIHLFYLHDLQIKGTYALLNISIFPGTPGLRITLERREQTNIVRKIHPE